MRAEQRRGSTLVVVLVVMAVLSVLAIGAIAFTGTERDAAIHDSKANELQSCTETARAHLLARLRVMGVPELIEFVDVLPDDADPARRSVARTGHYGPTVDGGALGVERVEMGVSNNAPRARDLSNLIAPANLGGSYYRIVVSCDTRGRQREVEFLVRFGI